MKGINGKVQANRAKKIKRDPLAAVFYYNRGLAYYHSQDPAKAIADFTRALKLDPKKESEL
jgi:tetratricopeptide (TPR) repeat protein